MRILMIEDDPVTVRIIETVLWKAGMNTCVADSGEEGLQLAAAYGFDLMLVDVMLPDTDGHQLVKKLRESKVATPAIMLTSINDPPSKVKALDCGADDYLVKPVDHDELVARIHAIVRRSNGHAQSVIRIGRMTVNLSGGTVQVDGRPVHLTAKEYEVLELLSLRKGSTISKETFLDHLYGGLDEPDMRIVDAFICRLRKKLSLAAGGQDYIRTVWGRGYALQDRPAEMATMAGHM